MPAGTGTDDNPRAAPGALLWIAWCAVLLGAIAAASSIGGPQGPFLGLFGVLDMLVRAGWIVVVIAAAAYGWGVLAARALAPQPDAPHKIRAGLGIAALFGVWHLVGLVGWLHPAAAWGTVLVGLVTTGWMLTRFARGVAERQAPPPPGWAWVGLPGLAVLLTAACSPPGALWASEFSGYDALSYHLPLPQAWLADGRVWPAEHCVYSYLPSYMESGFAWIGALTLAPATPSPGDPAVGMLAGGGWRLISCHLLHAGTTIAAAWLVTGLACRLVSRFTEHREFTGERIASAVAGGLVLITPWAVVVGSLAYNEMGVCVLGAAALLGASDRSLTPWRRGVLAGLLVGAACGFKPTALFMVGPAVGLALLASIPMRRWLVPVALGSLAGSVMLAPWMVRNAAATGGNPVFPYATAQTTAAHWRPAQVERWDAAHRYGGGLADRLRLAVWDDPSAPASSPDVVRFRGLANPQWGLVPVLGAGALIALLAARSTRRLGLLLTAMIAAQLLSWLLLTHLQSRFLLPIVITMCPAIGLGASRLVRAFARVSAAQWLVPAAFAVLPCGSLVMLWADERAGRPNELLLVGPPIFTGIGLPPLNDPSPEAFTNALPGRQDLTMLLLGDATPLYFVGPTAWATTWDEHALTRAMRGSPEDPSVWIKALRQAGVGLVLINFSEIDRLARSGYAGESVSVERAGQFAERLAPIRSWRGSGRVLFAVPPAEPVD